jgi:hypothetical protein
MSMQYLGWQPSENGECRSSLESRLAVDAAVRDPGRLYMPKCSVSFSANSRARGVATAFPMAPMARERGTGNS